MNWYDRAAEELEDDLANGDITQGQYNQAMRELNYEWQEQEIHNNLGDTNG